MATQTRGSRPFGRALLRTQSDERLVALIRQGREPAFEELVRRYRPGLVAFAAAYAPTERAEDVVQESLVSSWNALRDSDAEIRLKPWLYTIVRNRALNARRDARSHQPLDESIDGVRTPEQIALDHEELERVVAAVGALPEGQRRALVRASLEGHSHEQIAASMRTSAGAVRQLIYRGRAGLRESLGALVPLPVVAALVGGGSAGPATIGVAAAGAGAAGVGGAGPIAIGAAALAIGAVAIGAGLSAERSRGTADADTGPDTEQRAQAASQGDGSRPDSGSSSADDSRETAQDRAQRVAERREELRERRQERREASRERAREQAEEQREQAQDAAEEQADAQEDAADEAADAAEDAAEAQQEAAEEAQEAAGDAAEEAADAAEDAAEDAADAAQDSSGSSSGPSESSGSSSDDD